jgi:hypothetical protein
MESIKNPVNIVAIICIPAKASFNRKNSQVVQSTPVFAKSIIAPPHSSIDIAISSFSFDILPDRVYA